MKFEFRAETFLKEKFQFVYCPSVCQTFPYKEPNEFNCSQLRGNSKRCFYSSVTLSRKNTTEAFLIAI